MFVEKLLIRTTSLFLLPTLGVLTRHSHTGLPRLACSALIPWAALEGAGMTEGKGILPKPTLAGCIPQPRGHEFCLNSNDREEWVCPSLYPRVCGQVPTSILLGGWGNEQ